MSLEHFHPVVQSWFTRRLGAPSPPQVEGWPRIREGGHTLIAAPTGTGKTLAAFLWAIDGLLRRGASLPDTTQVLYVSPLKALGNDMRKNLAAPLAELERLDPSFPEVRALVRTGDTPPGERTAMRRHPPHVLVTTPESLYLMLTSDSGRAMLRTVRTVIVDEIHAVAGDKRGSHLTLSLERLEALVEDDARDARARGEAATATDGRPTLQRIGLSATQKPLSDVARLLVGVDRPCALVDVGHRRRLDVAIELPDVPLETVCSTETWDRIVDLMAGQIHAHRTTIVFVNTRKLAERVAAKLARVLGEDVVTSHHGSLSRERRLEAEERLKRGALRALVATSSLELGIDVGEIDLVIQAGVTPSFAALLQRVGRSGHGLDRTPKGRLIPLTQDELVCAAALLDGLARGELDRTPQPGRPLDILAQQIVAACVPETWDEDRLFDTFRRAWPYRDLAREDFDAVVRLHAEGRFALLHRDGVNRRLRATRRARITALTGGGAIPDTGQYRVLAEPEATLVGTLDEDFAIESNVGDIFQLGTASWQILKVEPGIVRVADARGAPPNVPFWFGEAPARTRELSAAIARVREHARDPQWSAAELGLGREAALQLAGYLEEGAVALGAVPTPECVVLERFFDESGGMQLVLHAPFGGRINRAWGLALRKRFCRGFGFELQAAANEEAIVLSLGLQHSFPLEDVFDYLNPRVARDLLVQALLAAPMFGTRWRWNLSRSLLLARTQGGRRVPTPLLRMRAEDALAAAFPEVLACPETLPPGELPVPWEHPIVRQTIEDCLEEAMDVDGLLDVLEGLADGRIRRVAIDTPEPSAFARGILNAMPYAFLDDAPLEERRTQAVIARRRLDPRDADTLGALDPRAAARVRSEAWPDPRDPEEAHEALLWMGWIAEDEARAFGWAPWLEALSAAGRLRAETDGQGRTRWRAVESPDDPQALLRGRMEALGPVTLAERGAPAPGPWADDGVDLRNATCGEDDSDGAAAPELAPRWFRLPQLPASDETLLLALEARGAVMRCRMDGRTAWCDRRLLARIQGYTLERLRREIEPVTAAELWSFLGCWQHAAEGFRLEGPRGVAEVARKLAGFEAPAAAWESSLLPARVTAYRREWLDEVTLAGELAWGRLWGAGNAAARSTPTCLLRRDDLDTWRSLAARAANAPPPLSSYARSVLDALVRRGPSFTAELERASGLLPSHAEMGLAQLVAHGLVTCDSFAGLRRLMVTPARRERLARRMPLGGAGRWSLFRVAPGHAEPLALSTARPTFADDEVEFVARQYLARYGVVFRALLARERIPVPWTELVRAYRRAELRGDVRGGRFVQRFAGEQYALPEAVELLRRRRREARHAEPRGMQDAGASRRPLLVAVPLHVAAADPLNLEGVLTPEPRIPATAGRHVLIG